MWEEKVYKSKRKKINDRNCNVDELKKMIQWAAEKSAITSNVHNFIKNECNEANMARKIEKLFINY